MKNFKKLQMWQYGMNIVNMVFDLYEELPYSKVAELKGRSIRAAVSIPSNIAEGSSRRSEKDKFRFIEIALGSAFELETQCLALQSRPWAPKERIDGILVALASEQAMLVKFMGVLKV